MIRKEIKMKNAFFAVNIFFTIIFVVYLSFLVSFYEFDRFKFSLNYALGFLLLILTLTVLSLNKCDAGEASNAFKMFFSKNKFIYVKQLKEFKICRVERIDRKNGIIELLYCSEIRVGVNDLFLFH